MILSLILTGPISPGSGRKQKPVLERRSLSDLSRGHRQGDLMF